MAAIGWTALIALTIYQWILICRVIFSWVQLFSQQWTPRGLLLVIAEGSYTLTDPLLKPMRKLIKPLRIGNTHIDIAIIVLFLLVTLCFKVVTSMFF